MSEKTTVEFIEEWQSGALFLFGSLLVGLVVGAVLGQQVSAVVGLAGFGLGTVIAFLVLSYLRYGR